MGGETMPTDPLERMKKTAGGMGVADGPSRLNCRI
jgi:hypothetical protein